MSEQTSSRDESVAKVAGLVKGIRVAMLTSTDAQGRLVSRPMATQDVDFDGDIWFITERSAEHTRNLQANPRVNVAYSGSSSWVSVAGTARVVEDDPELMERLMPQGYRARGEQAILFSVGAWDVNCPQHIPQRFDAADVAAALAERDGRIAALEAEIAALRKNASSPGG